MYTYTYIHVHIFISYIYTNTHTHAHAHIFILIQVGYDWIDGLKAHANSVVDDTMFAFREHRFPYNTPQSKEAYYVRDIFENNYPQQTCIETVSGGFSVACSTAKAVEWDEEWKAAALSGSSGDQSGRAVKGVHDSATKCF